MPITRITVKMAGRQTAVIDEPFRMQVEQTTEYGHFSSDRLDVSGNTATLVLPVVESSTMDQVVADLVDAGRGWLRTINHIQPVDGQFRMDGDACFSWIPDSGTVKTYVSKERTPGGTLEETSYLLEKGGGVHILNMCAACGSCQPQAALRIMLEDIKLKLNEMKDKNLYDDMTATRRRGILRRSTMAPNAACNIPVRTWLVDIVDSHQLLGQYATCVHMWNYIAARAHSQTLVEPAPHDPSAILVRAKHAFPACLAGSPSHGTGGTVKCTIDIRRYQSASTANTDISVYVPPAFTEFLPFDNQSVGSHDATVTHDLSDATHKTVTTSTWQAGTAGTYCVSVYFMPFNYAELKDPLGNVMSEPNAIIDPPDPSDPYHSYVSSTTVQNADDGVTYPATRYSHGKATLTRLVKYNTADTGQTPTGADMYNKYKAYPSVVDHSAPFTWQITVTWTTTGIEETGGGVSSPVSHVTNMFLQTQRPRLPASNLLPAANDTGENKLFTEMTLYNVKPNGSL